jgi:hypothetical protein
MWAVAAIPVVVAFAYGFSGGRLVNALWAVVICIIFACVPISYLKQVYVVIGATTIAEQTIFGLRTRTNIKRNDVTGVIAIGSSVYLEVGNSRYFPIQKFLSKRQLRQIADILNVPVSIRKSFLSSPQK